jgi:hypothetical protein
VVPANAVEQLASSKTALADLRIVFIIVLSSMGG